MSSVDWETYEKIMGPLRELAKAEPEPVIPPKKEKKKEAPYSNKELFKKIIGS